MQWKNTDWMIYVGSMLLAKEFLFAHALVCLVSGLFVVKHMNVKSLYSHFVLVLDSPT